MTNGSSLSGLPTSICHWSFVIGHLSLVICHWSLVIGHWSLLLFRLHFTQHLIESLQEFIDIFARDDKGREQAQHGFMRRVCDDPAFQQPLDDVFCHTAELNADNQSQSPNFLHRGMLTTEPPQAFQEITSQLFHSPQEALLFDDVKYFQCKAAGQRAPAERGSVLARFETLSHPGVAENGAEGISRGQRLCERHQVGLNFMMLKSEISPGPAHAALNLVENQQGVKSVAQLPGGPKEFARNQDDSGFSLDRLDHQGAHPFIEGSLERLNCELFDDQHVGYQGPERGLVFLLGSYAERAERSSVEGILEREDEGLVRFPSRARIGAGDLERRFHRLGSAVRKEDLRHPRAIG